MPELMTCALPYHATGEFVRLVQILPLAGTIWAFLRPLQKSGAPLPRPVLVRRCANDLVSATGRASCTVRQSLSSDIVSHDMFVAHPLCPNETRQVPYEQCMHTNTRWLP